ncbi:nitrogen fixation protein NifH [bacterium]|nr:nitrogen fixation protein NifH [bacterium]
MTSKTQLNPTTLDWLLEEKEPGVRYLALRDLEALPSDKPELVKARRKAHVDGPIATVLDAMAPEGYWVNPGPGYNPKYRSTVWALILLGQLGASVAEDERIGTACSYLLDNALTEHGQSTTTGSPGSNADCLQGNLCAALSDLGVEDPRLDLAFDWMARSVTGEGLASKGDKSKPMRYYAGNCGPDFACGANFNKACAWGAVKVMLAFSKLPEERRTPLIHRAIRHGIDFLLQGDPADAPYPHSVAGKPSRRWWQFSFPVFYVTDLLQNIEALTALGLGDDPRLANAIKFILDKRDQNGRWALEHHYNDKTWVGFGAKKEPNKWVTYRAMKVLKQAGFTVIS